MKNNRENLGLEDILTDRVVEEDILEIPLADRVFRFFLALVSVIVLIVLLQLVNIGFLKSSLYSKRALANASDIYSEPAPRGIIFDRFGKALLGNKEDLKVFLLPDKLPKDEAQRKKTLDQISRIFNLDPEELIGRISSK